MADGPGLRFTSWYRLDEALEELPGGAGVFQVRGPELLSYPKGRSAMLYYGSGPELAAAVSAFIEVHGTHDWLCRHALVSGRRSHDVHCERLTKRFEARFGCAPSPSRA